MNPMLVVSDASPLNILVRLRQAHVLASLFTSVVVPASVAEEMSRATTPEMVRDWITHPPPWLSIQNPKMNAPASMQRHRGERDAIQLAQELNADAILLDEAKPRAEASALGLRVIGTIGLLEEAANGGHVDNLAALYDQLRNTDFFISEEILRNSLARHLARKPR